MTTATVAPVGQCDETTARVLTIALRKSLTTSWELLVEAYQRRAWAALGYESWDAYTDAELGETRLRLPREQRREVVASMTEAGMSTRAIGSALGVADQTVRADQSKVRDFTQQVSQIGTPEEPVDAEIVDDDPEAMEREVRAAILGADGKTYRAPTASITPRRKPLTDAFWQAAYDLSKLTERITRLAADDRFTANAEQIAAANRADLLRAIDVLQDVTNRLPSA